MSRSDAAKLRPDIPSLRRALLTWYRREGRDLPWRRTRDPYAVWISEVMLQQTTVAAVIPYYERFLSRFPDLASLGSADEDELLALWSGLGYYRRARNLRAAARIIMEEHGGRFPTDARDLEALPGIGRYTAGAIASNCFDAALPALDTNAERVVARVYAVSENGAALTGNGTTAAEGGTKRQGARSGASARMAELWRIGADLVPPQSPGDWTQALMELGATICKPVNPDCGICPVATDCTAFARGDPAAYVAKRAKSAAVSVRAALVVIERGSRILLVRRGEDELLGGLWELPGTLGTALASSSRRALAALPSRVPGGDMASDSRARGERGHQSPARGARVRESRTHGDRKQVHDRDDGASRSPGRDAAVHQSPARGARPPGASAREIAKSLRTTMGFAPSRLRQQSSVRHTVTHRRLEITVWTAGTPASIPVRFRKMASQSHRWVERASVSSLPIGAASHKALSALANRTADTPVE